MKQEAVKIREVAAAYRTANQLIEEEELQRLRHEDPAILMQEFDNLVKLGCTLLPKTPEEWERFEADRELVEYQVKAMKAAAILKKS